MAPTWKQYIRQRQEAPDPATEIPEAASPLDRPIPVTFFADRFANSKTEEITTLRKLVERLSTKRAASKAALPWLKLASFGNQRTVKGSYRNDENILAISGVEADYDGEAITIDRARTILSGAGLAAIIYTSPSHTAERPRWRVLCPTSVQLPMAARAALVARVNGLFVGALAAESFAASQSYYYGAVTGNEANHEVVVIDGKAVDLADELDTSAVGRQKPEPVAPRVIQPVVRQQSGGGTHYALAALDDECQAIRTAPDGAKHATINKSAYSIGGLVTAGELEEGPAFADLSNALSAILPYCKDKRAAEATLKNAFREGMGHPRDVPVMPEPAVEEIHPAAGLIAKMSAKAAKKSAEPLPVNGDIMAVDGILKILVDECVRTAIRPQPFLALGAAICAIGALAGRQYRTRTDLRTNIYVGAIAESGGGKDHAPEIIKRCIDAAGLERYLGGETLASGRAVLSALEGHPAKLFLVDEFGMFLTGVTGKKAAPHKAEIWSELMKLYSRAKGVYRGTEYANKKDNPRIDINQPCVSFYGTTTPLTFWGALEGGAMSDGSLARFLIFISDNNRPERNKYAGIFEPKPGLLKALQAVARGKGEAPPLGNLPSIYTAPMAATKPAEPYTVPMTPNADKLHDLRLVGEDRWARRVEGTPQAAIVNRLGENAAKLSLISAISRCPSDPLIEERDVAWGWEVAEHCARSLLQDADRFIADSEFGGKINKVLDIIRRHGPISAGEMFEKNLRIPQRDRSEVIATLIEAGKVQAVEFPAGPKGGRPTIRYRAISQGREQPTSEIQESE